MATDADVWGTTDAGVLGFIRAYCGWHIAPVRTEVVYPRDVSRRHLALPTLKLVSVDGVTVDGVAMAEPLVDVDWAEDGTLEGPACWSHRLRGNAIEITHGHATAPAELLALARPLKSLMEAGGAGSVRVGNISLTPSAVSAASAGLPPYMLTVLDTYKLPPLS